MENNGLRKILRIGAAGLALTLEALIGSGCSYIGRGGQEAPAEVSAIECFAFDKVDKTYRQLLKTIYKNFDIALSEMSIEEKERIFRKYDSELPIEKRAKFKECYPWIDPDNLLDTDKMVIEKDYDIHELEEIKQLYAKIRKLPPERKNVLVREFDDKFKEDEELMKEFPWIDPKNITTEDKLVILDSLSAMREVQKLIHP